ncbi:MAG: hypothetical protein R3281_09320 [Balneolaceae bacterium]|nr:hypothetical protein [Balneolaceae bacterium]
MASRFLSFCIWCVLVVLQFALTEESRAQSYNPDQVLATGPYWSPDGQKVAFSASYFGNFDIYVINLIDGERERITEHPANDLYPSWSPDNHHIAFYSDRESEVPPHPPDTIIYKIKGLYETYARDGYKPSWSPDGNTILAHLRSERGNYEIYTMNREARDRKPLTWNLASDVHPRFSPDGSKIVFVSGRDAQPEIYRMNADGSGQQRLTYSKAYSLDPVWSPDGKQIAYISNLSGFFDVYTMQADGSGKKRITRSSAYDISPVWSPDGSRILFSSDRENGIFNLFVMNADGSNVKRLTAGEGNEYYGSWSPDGRQIAYLSTREGTTNLYVIRADGSWQRQLTR